MKKYKKWWSKSSFLIIEMSSSLRFAFFSSECSSRHDLGGKRWKLSTLKNIRLLLQPFYFSSVFCGFRIFSGSVSDQGRSSSRKLLFLSSICFGISVSRYSKYLHIPQELRIRSRGTERCSASNWAKLSRFISYHYLFCDPCQEIQDDMPWRSFGLSRHPHRWNPQKADTIRILESVR